MEKTLTVDDKTALQIYPNAAPEFKALLERAFTKDFFSGKITDRVFSFEDACRETGKDPNDPFFSACRPHENAERKIEVWALALNENKDLSYADSSTQKWRVWVIWDDSIAGFRFGGSCCVCPLSRAGLGSRTAFASKALAEHFAKYAMPLINESLK